MARVVRVVPDVSGIHKAFDYLVPPSMDGAVRVGAPVRVLLHNRRVNGWVVEDHVSPPPGVQPRPVLAVRGWGPPPAVVELARWAAWRWAGPLPRLLGTASAPTVVSALPGTGATARAGPAQTTGPPGAAGRTEGTTVLRLAPAHDPFAVVEAAAGRVAGGGSAVVLAASRRAAVRLAGRLRGAGYPVALLPEHWGVARAGGVVAVGTRAAAFAPVPTLAAAVVLDAHDQAYQEERAPTYRAWEVLAERARREGAPCTLVSPCPSLELLEAGPLLLGSRRDERAGWPSVEVVDRRADDPRAGLYSERLVELVRWAAAGSGRRVLCVLNRTGRARLMACAGCGELASCARCGAALEQSAGADGVPLLRCRRCGGERPAVCAGCGSTRWRALRVGVTRARQELEALAGAPVAEVTGTEHDPPGVEGAAVVVGTEAVLHRLRRADAVCFLDFDAELLAPRLGAGEQALALLARAARVAAAGQGDGAERAPGRLVIQTRQPGHPVVRSALLADPGLQVDAERPVRAELGLPPFRAWALVSGPAAEVYGPALAVAATAVGAEVRGPNDGLWSVLAADHAILADLLASVPRPAGRLRVEVDPARA